MKKRFVSALLAISMLGSMLVSAGAATAGNEEGEATPPPEDSVSTLEPASDEVFFETTEPENCIPDESVQPDDIRAMDNDALFDMYLNSLINGGNGISTLADYGKTHLEGVNLEVYNLLKTQIGKVAKGEVTSTQNWVIKTPAFIDGEKGDQLPAGAVEIGAITTGTGTWANSEVIPGTSDKKPDKTAAQNAYNDMANQVNWPEIVDCLLVDCPYELYWFNKTAGYSYGAGSASYSYSVTTGNIDAGEVRVPYLTVSMKVSTDYQDGDIYTVGNDKLLTVNTALAKAEEIAGKYKGQDAANQMKGFKDEICNLVEYNHTAVESNPKAPYGDPWQLIWVFDGDPSTEVVCEGYSKAFQYLCDKAGLQSYIVTGNMSGGTGAGAHMWNIVTLDGNNYLVDVTNSDGNSVGSKGEQLFLKAPKSGGGKYSDTYVFATGGIDNTTAQDITYTYDSDTKALYDESYLTLAGTDYVINTPKPSATATIEVLDDAGSPTATIAADGSTTIDLTYSEPLTVRVSNIIAEAKATGATDGKVSLKKGTAELGTANAGENLDPGKPTDVADIIYRTEGKKLDIGKHTLTVEYSGNEALAASTLATFTLNLERKDINPYIVNGETLQAAYNGTTEFTITDTAELEKICIDTSVDGTKLKAASATVKLADGDTANAGLHNNATLTAATLADPVLNKYYSIHTDGFDIAVLPYEIEVDFAGTPSEVKTGNPIEIQIAAKNLPQDGADPKAKLTATVNDIETELGDNIIKGKRDGTNFTWTGTYTNETLKKSDKVKFTLTLLKEIESASTPNYTISDSGNAGIGYIEHEVTILDKDPATAKITPEETTLNYGDTLTVNVSGIAAAQSKAKLRGLDPDKLYLYNGNNLLADTKVSNNGGTLTYETKNKGLAIGENTLTVKYGGNAELAATESLGAVTVTLKPRQLIAGDVTVPYKGENYVNETAHLSGEIMDVDEGKLTAAFSTGGKNAGIYFVGSTDNPLTIGFSCPKDANNEDYYALQDKQSRFTITPAPLEITGATLDGKTYDGTKSASVKSVTFGGLVNGETLAPDTDYTASAEFTDANAGTGKTADVTVTLKGDAAKNYEAPTPFKLTGQTIKQAQAQALASEAYITKLAPGFTAKVDLAALPNLGAAPEGGKPKFEVQAAGSYSGLSSATIDSDGHTLLLASNGTYTGTADDTVTVKVSNLLNYEGGAITVTVKYVDKSVLTISGVTAPGKTYDGKKAAYDNSKVKVSGAEEGKPFNTSSLVYTWYVKDGSALPDAPVNAGDYTLKVTVPGSDANYTGLLELQVSISKAEVTVTPKDKFIRVGGTVPDFTTVTENDYTVTGLVGGDTLASITLSYAGGKPSGNAAGDFQINAAATLANSGNYNLTLTPGTLHILQAGAILFGNERWTDSGTKTDTFYYSNKDTKFSLAGTGEQAAYFTSGSPISVNSVAEWTDYTPDALIALPAGHAYIAAKFTPAGGSTYFITSPKLELLDTTPAIEGLISEAVYCEAPTITVKNVKADGASTLATGSDTVVTANGVKLPLANGECTLPANGRQTVTATNKAGKSASIIVTVNNGHDFTTETIDSSCVSGGIVKQTCRACGKVVTTGTGAKGHTWADKREEPSCTKPGRTFKLCTTCGAVKDDTEIPAAGHKAANGWKSDSVNHWQTCSVCGITLDTVKHTESNWEKASGSVEKKDCTVCKARIAERTILNDEASGVNTLEKKTEVEPGAPQTAVKSDVTEIWKAVKENLPPEVQPTDDEKKMDVNITLSLDVKPVRENDGSAPKKDIDEINKVIEAQKPSGAKLQDAIFMDISLSAKKSVDGLPAGSETIATTKNELSITITVPEQLRKAANGMQRAFSVFRYHDSDNKAEKLNGTYNESDGSFTFNTNKFSTYALVYTDTEVKKQDPVTDDDDDEIITNRPSYGGGSSGGSGGGGSSSGASQQPAGKPDENKTDDGTTDDNTPSGSSQASFTDVHPDDWFSGAVSYAVEHGLMNGVGNGEFAPNRTTTRGMIVTMLHRQENSPAAGKAGFSDVPAGQWFTDAVAWAADNGIVNGYGNSSFGPNDNITRQQLAVILWRYAKYKGWDVNAGENGSLASYTDADKASGYALPALQWACAAGIINGKGNNILDPQGSATRAETAAMLQRFLESNP